MIIIIYSHFERKTITTCIAQKISNSAHLHSLTYLTFLAITSLRSFSSHLIPLNLFSSLPFPSLPLSLFLFVSFSLLSSSWLHYLPPDSYFILRHSHYSCSSFIQEITNSRYVSIVLEVPRLCYQSYHKEPVMCNKFHPSH